MPEDEFKGEQKTIGSYIALTPLVAASAMLVGGVRQGLSSFRQQELDPFTKVVSGKYRQFFTDIEQWVPELAELSPEVKEYVLESFRRRLGQTGLAATTMDEAIAASQQAPAIKLHLKQAFDEFRNVKPGQIGAKMSELLAPIPITLEGGAPLTNIQAVRNLLATPSLGLTEEMQRGLAAELSSFGAYAEEFLGTKPTFQMQMVGKDTAVSELLINFYRKGGEVQFKLPIPSASGMVTRANGSQAAARRVVGNLAGVASGAEEIVEMTAPEFALRRLRKIIPQEDFFQQIRGLEADVRRLLISAPGETPEMVSTFASQLVLDPFREAHRATVIQARERMARMGLGAGMPAGPLGKGVFWRQGAAPDVLAPPHYGQAMTKAFPTAGPLEAPLFQVSPAALEEAGAQLGMGAMVPRQDQILMAQGMESKLRGRIQRRMYLDPNAPASARFQKIMNLLNDNKTTEQMLSGGSTVEEAMATYMTTTRGTAYHQEMAALRFLEEGEVIGFTAAGAEKVKTYGVDTMIRDFRTVGGQSIVTTEGFYTPEKLFSPGGIKHSVEYGETEAVRALGIRGKALELMRARGIPIGDPSDLAFASQLRKAEIEAEQLYKGSVGLVVEGSGWEAWEKTGAGKKNFNRFNDMMRQKYMERFGALPAEVEAATPGQFRATIEAAVTAQGEVPEEFFRPEMLARRTEDLRLGAAAEQLGIGKMATFTDDAFDIMRMAGWEEMYTAMAGRVDKDATAMHTLIRAGEAARSTTPGITIPEMQARGFLRPGEEAAGTIFDVEGRARFFQETGGVIELPHEYRVQGMPVKRIAVPEFPGGYSGYYTTTEGRTILKELDASLRATMTASIADVGTSATTAAELAATEPLGRYFDVLGRMAVEERDIYGGKVIGSRRFAIGKEVPGVARGVAETGELIPQALIAPEAFEEMLATAEGRGLVDLDLAREMRMKFREGRLPAVGMKHPGRGMGFLPFHLGAAPEAAELGWAPSKTFAYMSEDLLPIFMGDLDFDPFEMDLLMSREAMGEAATALESGQVNAMINEHGRIRSILGDPKIAKGVAAGPGVFAPGGEVSADFIAARIEREALSKRNVGLFTTRVGWPAAVSAESAGFNFWDMFKMRVWRETLEERATHKVKHHLELPAGIVDEMAEAWRAGKADKIAERTKTLFGLQPGQTEEFESVINRMVKSWQTMGVEDREFVEAMYATRGRAGARSFLQFADRTTTTGQAAGRFVSEVTGEGGKLTAGMSKALSGVGDALRSRKKGVLMALGASAAIAALTIRPRDMTPEAVQSGQLAGGEVREPAVRSPMPQLKKNLYYRKGTRPGYRVNATTNRVADHYRLAQSVSQVSGDLPTTVNVNDTRRKVNREDIERAMRSDPVLGARKLESGYFNGSRYR